MRTIIVPFLELLELMRVKKFAECLARNKREIDPVWTALSA